MEGINERKKEDEGLRYKINYFLLNFNEFLHWFVVMKSAHFKLSTVTKNVKRNFKKHKDNLENYGGGQIILR